MIRGNVKEVTTPEGEIVKIKKLNPRTLLASGGLITSMGRKPVVGNPKQKMASLLEQELTKIEESFDKETDMSILEEALIKYDELSKKLLKLKKEEIEEANNLQALILMGGMVSPEISNETKEGKVGVNDLSIETMNFLTQEIMKFSGLVSEESNKLEKFPKE